MNFDIKRVAADFDRAAKAYDQHAALQQNVLAEALEVAEDYFPKKAKILDAGCGTGQLQRLASRLAWQITQVDLAFSMCKTAQKHSPLTVNADITALPFTDSSFDGIVSSLVLQWVNDIPLAMQEFARVLKPGGVAVLATFGPSTLHELRAAFTAIDPLPHVSEFKAMREFFAEAAKAGLQMLQFSQRLEHLQFPNATGLMRHLKLLGARHKMVQHRRGVMTPRQLKKLNAFYREHYASGNAITSSWEIGMMAVKKA